MPALEPIANEAERRGHDVTFTTDYSKVGDVGVYCRSESILEANKPPKLSVITFHGIDDAYRGAYWLAEKDRGWDRYDIGLLPGQAAIENWQEQTSSPNAHPRLGMFEVGWPKADRIISEHFKTKVDKLKGDIGIGEGRSVLYAPTSEDHGKIFEFIEKCSGISDQLLIKLAPYEKLEYTEEFETLDELYSEIRSYENIHIFDKEADIWACLTLADIIISDQSSVLNEALLTETIPISVIDWPVREGKPANAKDHHLDFVIQSSADDLQSCVKESFQNYDEISAKLEELRSQHYSHLGNSAALTMDLIEAASSEKPLPLDPITPQKRPTLYESFRLQTVRSMPERMINSLKTARIDKLESMIR